MKALFLAYQDQSSRRWTPVARLTRADGEYRLTYTRGALSVSGFAGFGRMQKLDKVFVSKDLFPLFANRVLPKSRPEYADYLEWLGLSPETHDDLEELARTGGLRATDSLELIPCPEPTANNEYEAFFFIRGIRHFPSEVADRCSRLEKDERLYLMSDFQNQHDPYALLLRTGDPISAIGYSPKYYAKDFNLLAANDPMHYTPVVRVERVNLDAPMQYRVLCRITAPWPKFFEACSSEIFQPISGDEDKSKGVRFI